MGLSAICRISYTFNSFVFLITHGDSTVIRPNLVIQMLCERAPFTLKKRTSFWILVVQLAVLDTAGKTASGKRWERKKAKKRISGAILEDQSSLVEGV